VNQALKGLPLHSEYNLLVAAARNEGNADFTYNPDGSWIVQPNQTLIVLGKADDVKRAREVAQPI
jgi:Trk K+ transport system NAD-binding subunit